MVTIKIGLIVNPIAGMGGAVGLKGTDGKGILEKAIQLGAQPQSGRRCKEFLNNLTVPNESITFLTWKGDMGENQLKQTNFKYELIDLDRDSGDRTSSEDTIAVAKAFKDNKVSIIVFCGGDGTARDIYKAIGTSVPCIGIPAGVKIHSSVYAINPKAGAALLMNFMAGTADLRENEVMDIDEDAFRDNKVISKLYGYLSTPYVPLYVQTSKVASPSTETEHENQMDVAQFVVDEMDGDTFYLLGPGTTVRAISEVLNCEKTLLGVDLCKNKQVIKKDLNEQEILEVFEQHKGSNFKLIITPIGAQGFVFGRGNLQVSAKVLEKLKPDNIIIVCSRFKYSTLPEGKLRIDSRNSETDELFKGYYKVIVGYGTYRIAEMV
jgi:predicted polyphosphate/ATP-dependent NAD kinase